MCHYILNEIINLLLLKASICLKKSKKQKQIVAHITVFGGVTSCSQTDGNGRFVKI